MPKTDPLLEIAARIRDGYYANDREWLLQDLLVAAAAHCDAQGETALACVCETRAKGVRRGAFKLPGQQGVQRQR